MYSRVYCLISEVVRQRKRAPAHCLAYIPVGSFYLFVVFRRAVVLKLNRSTQKDVLFCVLFTILPLATQRGDFFPQSQRFANARQMKYFKVEEINEVVDSLLIYYTVRHSALHRPPDGFNRSPFQMVPAAFSRYSGRTD